MKMIKRFVALTSALVLVASLVIVPVHAEDSLATTGEGWIMPSNGGATAVTPAGIVSISTDFASMLINEIGGGIRDDISSAARWFYSKINEDYCAETENHRHSFVKQHTMVDGIAKNYYVCESCGKSAGEVYDDAYDSYVGDMPVNGIDSAGGFYWRPSLSDSYRIGLKFRYSGSFCHWLVTDGLPITKDYDDQGDFTVSDYSDYVLFTVAPKSGKSYFDSGNIFYSLNNYYIAPISGVYTLIGRGIAVDGYYDMKNGERVEGLKLSWADKSLGHYDEDGYISIFLEGEHASSSNYFSYALGKVFFPLFRVVPDSAPDSTLYTPDTRPGTISGKYLVQNGDAYEDSSTTIINEDDNSIYNPVTNTTTNYDSWSYDYSTRTYTMMDNTNNSVSTVTYGDENITINEGGNTYNVYYGTVINNNGGDDSGNGGNNGGGTDIDFPSNTGIDTLGERLKVYFQRLPEMMGDINNFLSDAFPYIPQDLLYLIEFSLTISLFMAIIKMIRR